MPLAHSKKIFAEIICVGTELTKGRVINTNASFLAKELTSLGLSVHTHTVVADEPPKIIRAIRQAERRAGIIFITGGLGPTADDLTAAAVAQLIGKPLVRSAAALPCILQFLKERRRVLTTADLKMTQIPQGAVPFCNHNGMACGFGLWFRSSCLLVTPGVPAELALMFEKEILPFLRKKILPKKSAQNYAARILKFYGLTESHLDREIKRLRLHEQFPGIKIGFSLAFPEVHLVLELFSRQSVTALEAWLNRAEFLIRSRLEGKIVAINEASLGEKIHQLLLEKNMKLALAESCTAGLVAAAITEQPGSSAYFLGGIVCYCNESKVRDLSVSAEIIERYGAVSLECANAMAQGVRERFGADIGLAITGIAGPDGGREQKPVGTVFIAIDWNGKNFCEQYHFGGDRKRVRQMAQYVALHNLRVTLGFP